MGDESLRISSELLTQVGVGENVLGEPVAYGGEVQLEAVNVVDTAKMLENRETPEGIFFWGRSLDSQGFFDIASGQQGNAHSAVGIPSGYNGPEAMYLLRLRVPSSDQESSVLFIPVAVSYPYGVAMNSIVNAGLIGVLSDGTYRRNRDIIQQYLGSLRGKITANSDSKQRLAQSILNGLGRVREDNDPFAGQAHMLISTEKYLLIAKVINKILSDANKNGTLS